MTHKELKELTVKTLRERLAKLPPEADDCLIAHDDGGRIIEFFHVRYSQDSPFHQVWLE